MQTLKSNRLSTFKGSVGRLATFITVAVASFFFVAVPMLFATTYDNSNFVDSVSYRDYSFVPIKDIGGTQTDFLIGSMDLQLYINDDYFSHGSPSVSLVLHNYTTNTWKDCVSNSLVLSYANSNQIGSSPTPRNTTTWTFSGSECNLLAGNEYEFYYYADGAFSSHIDGFGGTGHSTMTTTPFGDTSYADYWWRITTGSSGGGPTDPYAGTTHIWQTTPADLAIVATSTSFTFGATGEVTPADYDSSSVVKIEWYNNTLYEGAYPASFTAVHKISFPLSASGAFDVSTTTDMSTQALGLYTMTVSISHDKYDFFGISFWGVDDVKNTYSFNISASSTLATYSEWDKNIKLIETGSSDPANYGKGVSIISNGCDVPFFGMASTTVMSFARCLIFPSSIELSKMGSDFYKNVLTLFPFGYITRFVSILASTTPVSVPALSYKFGSSSPASLQAITANDAVTFNPFSSAYYSSSSPLMGIRADDGTNKNVWDIIDPWFQTIVTIGILLMMLDELLGFQFATRETGLENYRDFSTNDIRIAKQKGDNEIASNKNKIQII